VSWISAANLRSSRPRGTLGWATSFGSLAAAWTAGT
jgi:hypothetical protein